jgi:hypothetical protein
MAIGFSMVFCAYSAGPERWPALHTVLLAAQGMLPIARACGCCLWGLGMVWLVSGFFLLSLVEAGFFWLKVRVGWIVGRFLRNLQYVSVGFI